MSAPTTRSSATLARPPYRLTMAVNNTGANEYVTRAPAGGGGSTPPIVMNFSNITINGAGGMSEFAQMIRLELIRWGRSATKIGLA
jgi:hypothetical protein